jgi:predicted DNA binding CopG/RHH family protein
MTETRLVRTTVRLPEGLLKGLKMRALEDDQTLQELITEALSRYLKKGGRK